jgi:hypothetical protein
VSKGLTQRIHAVPSQTPGRVVVMHHGVVVAMGTISNLACIGAALSTPNADIYLNPNDAADFKTWQIADRAIRRLN